jgi:aryl-alcohol dehydrogenase-like predicted oxidoreductase
VEYRLLGRTGVRVSSFCLGTMMFGKGGNPDHDECIRMIHRSLDAGINVVDTADVYSLFETEEIVAKALKGRRDDVVLATKFYFPTSSEPNRRGGSRRYIVQAVEASLRRLDTEWIDLYQMHRPDPDTDLDETLSALSDLVRQGKVRMIGSSAHPAEAIVESQWISQQRGFERMRSEQLSYSIFVRACERDILPACQRSGMGVLVYGPLNGGWLSGKYRKGQEPPEGTRAARTWGGTRKWDTEREVVQRKLALVDALEAVARDAGISLTHLAMAFSLEHPAISTSIIGPRTMTQLDDLLAGSEVRLSTDTLDRIDALCAPGHDLDPFDVNVVLPGLTDLAQRRR